MYFHGTWTQAWMKSHTCDVIPTDVVSAVILRSFWVMDLLVEVMKNRSLYPHTVLFIINTMGREIFQNWGRLLEGKFSVQK